MRRHPKRTAWLVLSLLAATGGVSGQSLSEAIDDSRAIIERYMADSPTPGLSVAVHLGDRLVWAEGFGLANVELGVPTTSATLFRIGSISKPLTSAAVGLLYERGSLDLDAPVQRYVPSFPEKEYRITTRQLGGHLSGLPHYGPQDYQNFVPYDGVVHALDKFKDRPLLHRPNQRFSYSSFGFNLISAVVEGAAGEPFLDFMQTEVLEPLGLQNTVPDSYRTIVPNRTAFYDLNEEGRLENAHFTDNSDVWAGGGFLSTPTDLVTFGHALVTGRLLSQETQDILFTSMTSSEDGQTGYGFGWRVARGDDNELIVSHGGSHFGASAQLWVSVGQQLIVAVTTNMSGANIGPVVRSIVGSFGTLSIRP